MDGDRASPQSPIAADSPQQEAGYIPIRVLGRGAFGEAVLYRKTEDNSLVVWKEVDLQRLNDKERRESQNEIDILSMLNHTNIVSYYNHFLDGDTLLIEMEYVNGGNLYEKIASQQQLFPEEVVLWYFYQVVSAVAHIHEYGILHRDIKTLNIFLSKSGLVKLGDFGISRVLDTKSQMAQSYVGTPYYMSPELIRGEQYNQSSDIWSTGCVLYEMLTLTRVFDATNPLKLAYEIVQCDFEAIGPKYSEQLRQLAHDLLSKDPLKRPTAEGILKSPLLSSIANDLEKKVWELNSATRRTRMTSVMAAEVQPVVTSKTSELYFWGGGKRSPQKLEIFTKGRSALQVSAGQSHFAVVTVEKELYTWANAQGGVEMVGQLGHGDSAWYKAPKKVEQLEGIPVKQAACGEDFTVCVTDEGSVYTCGSDYYGCLGCDRQAGEEVYSPIPLEVFLTKPVTQVACGDSHVVALTRDGEVFSWGSGEYGRLGLGSEDDYSTPQQVQIRGKHAIQSVHAGPDSSFLIKVNGRVLACGSNEDNKLGFNSAAQGLRKRKEQISYDIPCKNTFSTVKPLSKFLIVSMSAGQTHTAVIDYIGHLMTFGCNKFGQLGLGDFKTRNSVSIVAGPLTGKQVTNVACGDGFTVVATADNLVYSWGLAENGRLGTSLSSSSIDKGKGSSGVCSSLPRPIFGSLHLVSNLACRHWHTIIVAEKVLAQKTIRSSHSSAAGHRAAGREDVGDNEYYEPCTAEGLTRDALSGPSQATVDSLAESSVPDWLRAELEDSEFIPANGVHPAEIEPVVSAYSPSDSAHSAVPATQEEAEEGPMPDWLRKELEGEFIPEPSLASAAATAAAAAAAAAAVPSLNLQMLSSTSSAAASSSHPYSPGTAQPVTSVSSIHLKPAQEPPSIEVGAVLRGPPDSDTSEEIKRLKASLAELREECQQWRGESVLLRGEASRFREENQRLDEECHTLHEENHRLDYTNQELARERDQLREDSLKLQELVAHQAGTIRAQAETIAHLEDKGIFHRDLQAEIWDLVDVWQQEWKAVVVNDLPRPKAICVSTQVEANDDDHQQVHEKRLSWDNLGSPEENKTWSRSNKADMMKSFKPGMISKCLKGVTTTEEMV